MMGWKGPQPSMTFEQYEMIRAAWAHRMGSKNRYAPDTVAALAREFGIHPKTAYGAAQRGIKRYEYEASRAES
jgi:hypothetical protein